MNIALWILQVLLGIFFLFIAYLPAKIPHAFKNISDEPGRVIVVYTPGGGHKFFEEFGPIARNGHPDREVD
jgi:hypothetical protein